jgi:hypothetical protein
MIPLGRAVVRKAGRPRAKNPRVQVAIGLPADVLACWRAGVLEGDRPGLADTHWRGESGHPSFLTRPTLLKMCAQFKR